jgi:hypothetical protein
LSLPVKSRFPETETAVRRDRFDISGYWAKVPSLRGLSKAERWRFGFVLLLALTMAFTAFRAYLIVAVLIVLPLLTFIAIRERRRHGRPF